MSGFCLLGCCFRHPENTVQNCPMNVDAVEIPISKSQNVKINLGCSIFKR